MRQILRAFRYRLIALCDLLEDWRINDVTINFLYSMKQIDSILPCFCSVIYHRQRQNVVRTSVTHSTDSSSAIFFLLLPHYDVISDLFLNRNMASWNVFVKKRHKKTFRVNREKRRLKWENLLKWSGYSESLNQNPPGSGKQREVSHCACVHSQLEKLGR